MFVIRLDSPTWQIFQLILTLLSIFSSMIYAFNATFGIDHFETNMIKNPDPDDYKARWQNLGIMNQMELIFELMFFIDFIC